mgnify:CR=1 FL=1
MEKIGDITKRVISNWVIEDEGRDIDIEVVWNRIIDENLRGHTYVNGLINNILYVKVDSSCYLSILNMKKEEIIKKLKNKGFRIKKMVLKL